MLLLFKYVLSQIGQGKDVNVLMFQYESKVVKACQICPGICQDISEFR